MPKIPKTVPWTATGRTLGEGGQAQVVEVKPSADAKVPAGAYAMKVNAAAVRVKHSSDSSAKLPPFRRLKILA